MALEGYAASSVIPITRDGGKFQPVWDDLQISASAINAAGPSGPAGRDQENGTITLAGNQTQSFTSSFQMPHSWYEGSIVRPHMHWYKSNSNEGDPTLEFRYAWAKVGELVPDIAQETWHPFQKIGIPHSNTAFKHAVWSAVETIDGTGQTISSILIVNVRRVAQGGDDYNGVVHVLSFDCHIQMAQRGSIGLYALP